jgi:acetolactate synthase small subunit
MNTILYVKFNNQPEALMRIMSLLRKRKFNIRNMSMMETANPMQAHLILMLREENRNMDQIIHQIEKCIDIYEVKNIAHVQAFEEEYYTRCIKEIFPSYSFENIEKM